MKTRPKTAARLPFAKKGDIIIVAALLGIALALFLIRHFTLPRSGAYAEILLGGSVIKTVELGKDAKFRIPGKPAVELQVTGGAIGFVHSDCPDQICVRTGFLHTPGDFAACLPNSVLLYIKGGEGPDTVVK